MWQGQFWLPGYWHHRFWSGPGKVQAAGSYGVAGRRFLQAMALAEEERARSHELMLQQRLAGERLQLDVLRNWAEFELGKKRMIDRMVTATILAEI